MAAIHNYGLGWELPRMYRCQQCRFCGIASGYDCPGVVCMACGSRVCHGYGLGNGCCPVCHHGILPSWTRSESAAGLADPDQVPGRIAKGAFAGAVGHVHRLLDHLGAGCLNAFEGGIAVIGRKDQETQ